MESIIIEPKTAADLDLFKQLAIRLKANFKLKDSKLTENEKAIALYGKAFVSKINESRKQPEQGKVTSISLDERKVLCN